MTTETKEEQALVNLQINGKPVAVPKGTTVYHAAIQQGAEIPIFCYHDRMPPFGACRVCLVEVEKMPKLQTSCTLEASEGMVVKTHSELAKEGRKEIIEFLLINHPLDCPICDKGGECPLQDQTIQFGPEKSRFYEEKRHFFKPMPLGPLLMLDRERCIICARCTRFGDLIAGDNALEFMERGFRTEVGTPGGKPAESKFIGNTIMICPVGALTSEVYRFRARPWDNKQTKTTCTLCPVGCSMILDQRDGEIMRTRSLENKQINDIWMCDKGWFGYEFSTYRARLQKPLIRRNGHLEVASWEDAFALVAAKIKEYLPNGKIAGWGGNPLTTEENFLFQKLIREGCKTNHLDHRIGQPIFGLQDEGLSPGMEIPIGDCAQLSTVVLLGVDITEEFPVIWLRLKQALNQGAKGIFIGNYAPEISPHLHKVVLHPPGEEIQTLKDVLVGQLENVQHGKIGLFVGRQHLASPHRAAILAELLTLREKFPNVSLNLLEGRGNSVGARLAGMHPECGPLGQRLPIPGLSANQVIEKTAREGWDLLYVAGADPAKKFPSAMWKEARSKLSFLVVQDIFLTETARQADVVFPSLCFVEKSGTFVNIAQQVQKINPGKEIPEGINSDAHIFRKIADLLGISLQNIVGIENLYQGTPPPVLRKTLINGLPYHKEASSENLRATFAHVLFDKGMRMKHNAHLIQMAKEPCVRIHPKEALKRNLNDSEMVRIKANGTTITAKLRLDKKVCEKTVVIPLGFDELPVYDLGSNLLNGMEVELIGNSI